MLSVQMMLHHYFGEIGVTNAAADAASPSLFGGALPSPEQRRSRHEGVERRQHLAAEAILLHQQLVARARHDEMRAGAQPHRELVDRRRRDDAVLTGRDDQDRLPDLARKA